MPNREEDELRHLGIRYTNFFNQVIKKSQKFSVLPEKLAVEVSLRSTRLRGKMKETLPISPSKVILSIKSYMLQ